MKTLQGNAGNKRKIKMASATLLDATINLINNECKKATAPEISRKIARCRGHMTTIRNKMDGNVRTLKTHPANDAAATELKRHLDDINAQYWRASYLMEIYISVIEEEARQEEREPDLRQVGEREEGMRKEYERACLIAQECLAEHQNMSDIRRGLSICLLYTSPSPRDRG